MPDTPLVGPIDLAIELVVPAADAWTAITDPARIAEWFTQASPLGEPGSAYTLDFGEGSVVRGTVLEVDPGRSFTHSWTWDDATAYETTTVTWSVEALPGGGSRVHLVHDGWHDAGLDAAVRDDHEGYWAGYLEDLGALLGEA